MALAQNRKNMIKKNIPEQMRIWKKWKHDRFINYYLHNWLAIHLEDGIYENVFELKGNKSNFKKIYRPF